MDRELRGYLILLVLTAVLVVGAWVAWGPPGEAPAKPVREQPISETSDGWGYDNGYW